jgi:cyclopropane-fatty-acyl-phospholipid synthase
MLRANTQALRETLGDALPERPFNVAFWDGTMLAATNGGAELTLTVRGPEALAHALRAPGQLGVGRAYVAGLIDVDDIDAALEVLGNWSPPPLDRGTQARLAAAAVRATGAAGLMRPPRRPASELVPRGRRHSAERDKRAVRHHYDLPPEFFALFLDESMTYSCAVFSRGAKTLEEAQATKLELVCTKLGLQPGERLLDVGCGWGSFAVHAAREHGVSVVGITLSEPQARRARARAEEAGVADRVEFRVQDWREIGEERFDAIASIGMVEHVGNASIDDYAVRLARLLEPGGRLLNHGIARLRHTDPEAGPFSERYVFPDAAPLHLSRVLFALERAGLAPEHVEGLAADYAETLRHWAQRFDDHLEEATALAGAERVRVWRIYLRAARAGFERGFTSVFQVRCRKP